MCAILKQQLVVLLVLLVVRTSHQTARTALSVSCPCLVFVRIFRKILSGVCLLSGFCPDFRQVSVCLEFFRSSVQIVLKDLSGVYLLSGFCPDSVSGVCMSGFCPDLIKNLSAVCLSGRDRDRAVRTFTVLVHRRLPRTISERSVDQAWKNWDLGQEILNI